ncbi:MAG: CotH kinase family protein, partial [Rhodothermales bacterium]
YIDLDSFVDFVIVNEIGKNVDGYRLSTFLYKDKDSNGGALHAGPVWDFNLAFGNADYYGGADPEGFQYNFAQTGDNFPIPFWWKKLAESEGFQVALGNRWASLRQGVLHEDSLMQSVDAMATLLDEAQARNFERWPILGEYVWPNAFIGQTYAEEVDYLKGWLGERLAWLDANLPEATVVATEPGADVPEGYTMTAAYPNPFRGRTQFTLTVAQPQHVSVAVYDLLGRRVAHLHDSPLAAGRTHAFAFEAGTLPAGLYLIRAEGTSFSASRRVVVLRH